MLKTCKACKGKGQIDSYSICVISHAKKKRTTTCKYCKGEGSYDEMDSVPYGVRITDMYSYTIRQESKYTNIVLSNCSSGKKIKFNNVIDMAIKLKLSTDYIYLAIQRNYTLCDAVWRISSYCLSGKEERRKNE